MSNNQPIKLVSAQEIARRGRVCGMTVYRHIKKNGITPDAVLKTCGRKLIACFVEPRAKLLLQQITDHP